MLVFALRSVSLRQLPKWQEWRRGAAQRSSAQRCGGKGASGQPLARRTSHTRPVLYKRWQPKQEAQGLRQSGAVDRDHEWATTSDHDHEWAPQTQSCLALAACPSDLPCRHYKRQSISGKEG